MKTAQLPVTKNQRQADGLPVTLRRLPRFIARSMPTGLALFLLVAMGGGCQSSYSASPAAPAAVGEAGKLPAGQSLTLQAGDSLKISFPGASNLDTSQQIRRDGKITMPLVGEVEAAGVTPAALEKKLIDLYAGQLVSKEVMVTVVSSSFSVYVTGAVVRPGKVQSDRPLTALEAVMEAGGFDYDKADLKHVTVIRQEEGRTKNFSLNMKLVLDGKQTEPFYLRLSDIIYVPEKLF